MILMCLGIINVEKINYDENDKSKIISIDASFEEDNKNFKGKPTLTWGADNGLNNLGPLKIG